MKKNIHEIRIQKLEHISPIAQLKILKTVERLEKKFEWQGFVKTTYIITKSGLAIDSMEPLEGSPLKYFRMVFSVGESSQKQGIMQGGKRE